jgi:hypothetical protein
MYFTGDLFQCIYPIYSKMYMLTALNKSYLQQPGASNISVWASEFLTTYYMCIEWASKFCFYPVFGLVNSKIICQPLVYTCI